MFAWGRGTGAGIRRMYVKVQPVCSGPGARALSGPVRARAPLPACSLGGAAQWVGRAGGRGGAGARIT